MQLFNRMNKKTPSNVVTSSGGRGPSNRYIMQPTAQAGNENTFQNKKVRSTNKILNGFWRHMFFSENIVMRL